MRAHVHRGCGRPSYRHYCRARRSLAATATQGRRAVRSEHARIGSIDVRREVALGSTFSRDEFETGFDGFARLYNVMPSRAVCAPDVLARVCELLEPAGALPHAHSLRLSYRGVPIVAAVLPPGIIVFEGEVDDVRMGDW